MTIAASMTTFPAEIPNWNNLSVIHQNTLPPRASFVTYSNESDALSHQISKAKTQSLSGTWKFNLANSPFEAPADFQLPEHDVSDWASIEVPGMWQLQGHGKGPQYTNVVYPFPVDPPNVPYDNNETGSYIRNFKVLEPFRDHQLRLRFEGVDSAFNIWVNGKHVGYSQGARNPSEFDISDVVNVDGDNILAVQVYQWCDGSYIEDQVSLNPSVNCTFRVQIRNLSNCFPGNLAHGIMLGSMVAQRDFQRCCLGRLP